MPAALCDDEKSADSDSCNNGVPAADDRTDARAACDGWEVERVPSRDPGRRYTALELSAWRGLLHTHAYMREQLGAALESECGLSISEFEVLIMVNDGTSDSLRMSQLAERVLLTPSGLTRLVDRLERRGLVRRVRDGEGDGRSMRVSATDDGRELFAVAAQAHVARVRALFLKKMTRQEMETLAGVWAKVCDSSVPSR